MAAPSFKETLWGNGTISIYFDYTTYEIKNQAPVVGCFFNVLFEKVNSILVWILLFPYTTSLTMDFTDSMIKIYIGLDSSG